LLHEGRQGDPRILWTSQGIYSHLDLEYVDWQPSNELTALPEMLYILEVGSWIAPTALKTWVYQEHSDNRKEKAILVDHVDQHGDEQEIFYQHKETEGTIDPHDCHTVTRSLGAGRLERKVDQNLDYNIQQW